MDPGPDPGEQDKAGSGIGLALADAGYCSQANLTCPGPDRLIAVGKHRDLEKSRPRTGRRRRLGRRGRPDDARAAKTGDGIAAYRQRGHIAETPHGHIKHNMGLRQLSVRGKPKASAEWTFGCAIYNLFKAITTGHLTLQALTALAS